MLSLLAVQREASGCGEAVSRCVSIATALPAAAPTSFLTLHSWRTEPRPRLALETHYQRRPLVAVAASPDPFGREVPILSDWLTAALGFDFAAQPGLRFGANLPLALRLSGTGTTGLASVHADESDAVGVGDPEVLSSLTFALAGARAGVVQRITLPLGSAGSFLAHHGIRYAPSLSLAGDVSRLTFAVEVGARLKTSERFGDVRFGSEALLGAGVSSDLGRGLALAVEGLVLPALARDESTTSEAGVVRIRRVPAELIASLSWQHDSTRVMFAGGTSVPLTDRTSPSGSETLAGPPGPSLRVAVRAEQAF